MERDSHDIRSRISCRLAIVKPRFVPALAFVLLLGCQKSPTASKEPPKAYVLEGEVVKLDPSAQLATVNGQKIEGWMEAMTMEYPVRDKQAFGKLKVGEKIQAKVLVQGLDYWIADVNESPASGASAPSSK